VAAQDVGFIEIQLIYLLTTGYKPAYIRFIPKAHQSWSLLG
jgi:hypothetical protein